MSRLPICLLLTSRRLTSYPVSSHQSRTFFGTTCSSSLLLAVVSSLALWFKTYDNGINVARCLGSGQSKTCQQRRAQLDEFLKKSRQSDSSTVSTIALDLGKLPEYKSQEVSERNGQQQQSGKNNNSEVDGSAVVWMSYAGYVFDVTKFIPIHPGGTDRISRASGAAIEPYWFLHQQHFDKEEPLEILKSLIVGRLVEADQAQIDAEVDKLQDELDTFELIVDLTDFGDRHKIKKLSINELTRLPKTDQISQVGCTNNKGRRPVATSLFGGVKLKHLLPSKGDLLACGSVQLIFHAMDGESVSIEINDDKYEDILVCYEQDGSPLTKSRGFPLRIIIPDKRVVKWVQKITVKRGQ